MRQRIPLLGIAAMLSVLIFGSRFGPVHADSVSLPKNLDAYRHVHSFLVDDPGNPLFGMHHEAQDCFRRHTRVADRHYMFSRPLDLALPRP